MQFKWEKPTASVPAEAASAGEREATMTNHKYLKCSASSEALVSGARKAHACPRSSQVFPAPARTPRSPFILRARIGVAALAGLVLLLAMAASADVLIATDGTRWEGTLTEEGAHYVLVMIGGGRITFPKNAVAEVILSAGLLAEYEQLKSQADLSDDAQVRELADLAAAGGLAVEHEELMDEAFAMRYAVARADPDALRQLATWCAGYDLDDRAARCNTKISMLEFATRLAAAGGDATELEELAEWCAARDLEQQAAQCYTQAYQLRRYQAQNNAMAMVELFHWCSEHGLAPEAADAEAEALRLAPADDRVRQELGYVWDSAAQEWSRGPVAYTSWPFDAEEAARRQSETATRLGVATHLTLDLGGGVAMDFVLIPAGEFVMGSPTNEYGRDSDEGPTRRVRITKMFYMAACEVTQEQYEAVMSSNPSQFRGSRLPVEETTWNDATEFCRKFSALTGREIRLPTEAEWEYACRAGGTGAFAGSGNIDEMAWYEANSEGQTHPIATKKPNRWGLYDMHGNVSEWCSDYYKADYPEGPTVDPNGPAEGKYRVVRGGSWSNFARGCRSAARSSAPPSYQFKQTGFRVVLEVSQ